MTYEDRERLYKFDRRSVVDINQQYLSWELTYPEGYKIPKGFRFTGIATPKDEEWYLSGIDGKPCQNSYKFISPTTPRILLSKKKKGN